MFCHFCNRFLGILNMSYFCNDCAFLRRLYLLYDTQSFLEKVKTVFLVNENVSSTNVSSTNVNSNSVSSRSNDTDDEPPIRNFIDRRKDSKFIGYHD